VHGTGQEEHSTGNWHARPAGLPEAGDLPGKSGSEPGLPGTEVQTGDAAGLAAAKAALRAELLAARRLLTAEERAAAGRSLRDALLAEPEAQMAGTVAAYLSVGTEPDTRGLVFALWKRGSYVLLPLLRSDGDLDWASYEGPDSIAPGPRGLLEPAEPPRGVTAITSADLVIVPALAVDRRGIRLGRGGGSYDRALARVGPAILTVALLYDGELRADVPGGPSDVAVRAAACPAEGITRLG
jgi:5-formyltetrahydrofolate cyclo-ligase